jgi:hypothetical protein
MTADDNPRVLVPSRLIFWRIIGAEPNLNIDRKDKS